MKETIQSRRTFFKNACKRALIFLVPFGLAGIPRITLGAEKTPQYCKGCWGACESNCTGSCDSTCKGCGSSCSSTCSSTCKGCCENTCKGGCESSNR